MLQQQRFEAILKILDQEESVSSKELVMLIDASEATIRRDLTFLEEKGFLKRVHGGAVANSYYHMQDQEISFRETQNKLDKEKISTYAAQLIRSSDLVYIDAGTTTKLLVESILEREATYITNACAHAKILTQKGCMVHLIGGRYKYLSEATIGLESITNLSRYHFSIGFFGVNGVSIQSGFTTPEMDEGMVKEIAMKQCRKAYILSDNEKFDKTSMVSFGKLEDATIITTSLKNPEYKNYTTVIEVN